MRYRRLGNSGLKVSTISLGSWLTFGSSVNIEATRQCVRAAVDAGVNLIDTADIYAHGKAEEALGEVLKEYRRGDLVIATKLFWPVSDNVNDRGLSRKHIKESCDRSLRRLKVDYLDLYQCHRFDADTPIGETVQAMSDLIRAGKILYWGVSCWTAAQIVEACYLADLLGGYRPISNQPHYSLLFRAIESEVLPICERLGMGQIVWSPLEQGVLTGKYSGGVVPSDSRGADERSAGFINKWLKKDILDRVDKLAPIAERLNLTRAQLALAWTLRHKGIASAITGATKPAQVRENVAAADAELPAEVLDQIEVIFENKPAPAAGP